MGNARIDQRRDACSYHLTDVDAKGRSLEIPCRDREVGIVGDADLFHLVGHPERVFEAACSHEPGNAWRRHHSHTADAHCLCDRAVADIRVRILFRKSGEIKAVRRIDRSREPLISQAADTDAEVPSISRHSRYDTALFDLSGAVRHRFSCGHHNV